MAGMGLHLLTVKMLDALKMPGGRQAERIKSWGSQVSSVSPLSHPPAWGRRWGRACSREGLGALPSGGPITLGGPTGDRDAALPRMFGFVVQLYGDPIPLPAGLSCF